MVVYVYLWIHLVVFIFGLSVCIYLPNLHYIFNVSCLYSHGVRSTSQFFYWKASFPVGISASNIFILYLLTLVYHHFQCFTFSYFIFSSKWHEQVLLLFSLHCQQISLILSSTALQLLTVPLFIDQVVGASSLLLMIMITENMLLSKK